MTYFSQCQITRVLPRVADLSQLQITGVLHRDKECQPGYISRFNERQNRRPPSTKSESKVMEKAQIQSVSGPNGSGGSSTLIPLGPKPAQVNSVEKTVSIY